MKQCFFRSGHAQDVDYSNYSIDRMKCKDGKLHFICSLCMMLHVKENAHHNGENVQFVVNTHESGRVTFEVFLHAGMEYEAFHGFLLYILQFSPTTPSRFLTTGRYHMVTCNLPDNPFDATSGYSLYRYNRVHMYGQNFDRRNHFII